MKNKFENTGIFKIYVYKKTSYNLQKAIGSFYFIRLVFLPLCVQGNCLAIGSCQIFNLVRIGVRYTLSVCFSVPAFEGVARSRGCGQGRVAIFPLGVQVDRAVCRRGKVGHFRTVGISVNIARIRCPIGAAAGVLVFTVVYVVVQ